MFSDQSIWGGEGTGVAQNSMLVLWLNMNNLCRARPNLHRRGPGFQHVCIDRILVNIDCIGSVVGCVWGGGSVAMTTRYHTHWVRTRVQHRVPLTKARLTGIHQTLAQTIVITELSAATRTRAILTYVISKHLHPRYTHGLDWTCRTTHCHTGLVKMYWFFVNVYVCMYYFVDSWVYIYVLCQVSRGRTRTGHTPHLCYLYSAYVFVLGNRCLFFVCQHFFVPCQHS
jgi:hypothetical protein